MDGAKAPPVPDAAAVSDPSIAVELGSLDLELQEVATPTDVENDRGTGVDTPPLGARTRAEPTAHNAPTRPHASQAAYLAKPGRSDAPVAAAAPTPGVGMRFKRWVRRMTIRAALILVALGGAFYLARPATRCRS